MEPVAGAGSEERDMGGAAGNWERITRAGVKNGVLVVQYGVVGV